MHVKIFVSKLTEKNILPNNHSALWKDSCSRCIIQYATEKIPASKKAKFKKR